MQDANKILGKLDSYTCFEDYWELNQYGQEVRKQKLLKKID